MTLLKPEVRAPARLSMMRSAAARFTPVLAVLLLVAARNAALSAAAVTPSAASRASGSDEWLARWRADNKTWRGVHVMVQNDSAASELMAELRELAALGVNSLVLEINYGFAFESHPELREAGALTKEHAGRLACACRERAIRSIPLFNWLGHQSWSKNTGPLLTKYPDLDETPGQFPENKGIYCRSWCPQHPKVNEIVFALLDELIAAFDADAIHVGMDEVFLIASSYCPRCKDGDPAKLFAKAGRVVWGGLSVSHWQRKGRRSR